MHFASELRILLQHEHARVGYETDFHALALLFGIRVTYGKNAFATAEPPATIQSRRSERGSRKRFTGHHEITHVLMQRSGLEDDVLSYYPNLDDGEAMIEILANYGAGILLMPEPMVDAVRRKHRNGPASILHLARQARASLPAAMRRFVSADPYAEFAAVVTSGKYIADVATCNMRLPFWTYDRVPDIVERLPDASFMQLSPGKLLGVIAG